MIYLKGCIYWMHPFFQIYLIINADLFFYKNKPINIKELIETMAMVIRVDETELNYEIIALWRYTFRL